MGEIIIVEHALKHGASPEDIAYAWEHFHKKQHRGAPNEGEIVVVGPDRSGRPMQLVAAEREYGTIIFHAMRPPTRKILQELGLERRHR